MNRETKTKRKTKVNPNPIKAKSAKESKSKKRFFKTVEILMLIFVFALIVNILVKSTRTYLIDSKKVIIKDQARQVVMAVESMAISEKIEMDSAKTLEAIKLDQGVNIQILSKYITSINTIDKIDKLTIAQAKKIVSENYDFQVDEKGNFTNLIEK